MSASYKIPAVLYLPYPKAVSPHAVLLAILAICRGCSISVPHDIEGTLVRRYGPSWRTPKQVFTWGLLVPNQRGAAVNCMPGIVRAAVVSYCPCKIHVSACIAHCKYWTQPRAQWRAALLLHDIVFLPQFSSSSRIRRYLDKGADTVEGSKPYAKVLRLLAALGIRI